MLCVECNDSLLDASKRVYYCEKTTPDIKSDDAVFWCKKCAETTSHPHKLTKVKGKNLQKLMGDEEEDSNKKTAKYLDKLFEEYNNIDCEDKIAGGTVKTKFRYTNVPKQDFGLSNEEIFMLDDKQLN